MDKEVYELIIELLNECLRAIAKDKDRNWIVWREKQLERLRALIA